MKGLILGIVMFTGISDGNKSAKEDFSWVLEEMNTEIVHVAEVPLTENTISIFDKDWNMVSQYGEEEFIKNDLPLTDLKEVQDSELLFTYRGNSYYLTK